jgi:hypothetical protein
MKIPKKYLTKNPRVMKREILKHKDKEDSDSSAYGPWDADYKSRKAGKGKKVETKMSKYTKKYKEMFGESEDISFDPNLVGYDDFNSEIEQAAYEVYLELGESGENWDPVDEGSAAGSVDTTSSPANKALKKKAEKSGFPLGILKQVFKRGKAAWARGHIPGTTPDQWAHARVNSFITGGKTTKMHDKALYQQAKKARSEKRN